jgi:hypothetical protein
MPKYYDASQLLSFKRPFSIVVGIRGVGKTFKFTQLCIQESLANKSMAFIWLRRTQEEIKKIKLRFFDDMIANNLFPDWQFKVLGNDMYATNKTTKDKFIIGTFMALSTESQYTGTPFPNVKYLIFDEAMTSGRYVNEEMFHLLHLIDTIFRNRPVRTILLGNAFSMSNLYFEHFKINDLSNQFTSGENFVIENCSYKEFQSFRKETQFGKLISGGDYEKFALMNEFLLDDKYNVIAMPKGEVSYLGFNLKLGNQVIGCWLVNGLLYFGQSEKYGRNLTIYVEDAKNGESTWLEKSHPTIKFIGKEFVNGRCMFETMNIKNAIVLFVRQVIRNY